MQGPKPIVARWWLFAAGALALLAAGRAEAAIGPVPDVPREGRRDSTRRRSTYLIDEPPKGASLGALVDWLDPERSARYRPEDGSTYCNIFGVDAVDAWRRARGRKGPILPRQWWREGAAGEIHELNANSLFAWLATRGPAYGWRVEAATPDTITAAQRAVNGGAIAVVVGRRADRSRPGHITVIVPEGMAPGEMMASRDSSGRVIDPVQAQAGTVNHRRFLVGGRGSRWWTHRDLDAAIVATSI